MVPLRDPRHDYPYNEIDEDSVETKIKTFTKKLNEKNLKSKHLKKRKNTKLTSEKVCSQALQMIKFLGTLYMRKLDLKHEPRLRRIVFLEWISQLELAFQVTSILSRS